MKNDAKKVYALHFCSYLLFSLGITRFTPFLSEMGFNPFQRGTILSSVAVLAIIFQLVLGFVSDSFQTIKYIVIGLLFIYIPISFFVFDFSLKSFVLHLIIIAIIGGMNNTFTGLIDIWTMNINKSYQNKLSLFKSFGSAGWAIGSLATSLILSTLNYNGLSRIITILSIIVLILSYKIKDVEKVKKQKAITIKDFLKLFKKIDYIILIFSLVLIYSAIIANTNVVIDKMIYIEATNFEISLKWFISSFVEIPAYIFGHRIFNRFKSIRLLQFSSIVLIIQFILFSFSTSGVQIIFISLLQMFTTPIVMVASKLIIQEISPPDLLSSSQLIALSIFTGVSSLTVPIFTGYLSTSIGFDITLLIIAFISFIALLVTIFFNYISQFIRFAR